MTGRNYNRFSIFRDSDPYEFDDMTTLRNGSPTAHFVKFHQPKCPPIVAKENVISNVNWITISNRKKPLRKISHTEINENKQDRLFLMKLNTTSKKSVTNDDVNSSRRLNGSMNSHQAPNVGSTHKITPVPQKTNNLPATAIPCKTMSTPTQDVEMLPVTPENARRSKKTRHRTITTPDPPSSSKKKRASKSTSPKAKSTASPTQDKATSPKGHVNKQTGSVSQRTRSFSTKTPDVKYQKIHPSTDDDTIRGMSKDNLLQELKNITRKRKINISTDTFTKASRALLIRRAIAFKKLGSPLFQKKVYIHDTTPDDIIMAMVW